MEFAYIAFVNEDTYVPDTCGEGGGGLDSSALKHFLATPEALFSKACVSLTLPGSYSSLFLWHLSFARFSSVL